MKKLEIGDKVVVCTKRWDIFGRKKFGATGIITGTNVTNGGTDTFDYGIEYTSKVVDPIHGIVKNDYYDENEIRLITKLDKALK